MATQPADEHEPPEDSGRGCRAERVFYRTLPAMSHRDTLRTLRCARLLESDFHTQPSERRTQRHIRSLLNRTERTPPTPHDTTLTEVSGVHVIVFVSRENGLVPAISTISTRSPQSTRSLRSPTIDSLMRLRLLSAPASPTSIRRSQSYNSTPGQSSGPTQPSSPAAGSLEHRADAPSAAARPGSAAD